MPLLKRYCGPAGDARPYSAQTIILLDRSLACKSGKDVPRDMSVIGFGGDEIGRL